MTAPASPTTTLSQDAMPARAAGAALDVRAGVRVVTPTHAADIDATDAEAIVVDATGSPQQAAEACRQIRERPGGATVPLVALLPAESSGRADVLRAGADAVVGPADADLVAATTEAVMARAGREHAAVAEAARTRRDLESLLHAVSHDLRAPLRAVDGFSSALAETLGGTLDDTAADHLQRVRAAARRSTEMLEGLLDLSRLSRVTVTPVSTNLATQIRGAAATVSRRYPQAPVVIAPDVIEAVADAGLVQKLFERVFDNCCKFAAPGAAATIAIEALDAPDGREFVVRDRGVGFDPAYAGKLFRPFQRLHSAAEFPGIGIGLAIVHRIVERHGGRVAIDARPGEGATLRFTLAPPSAPSKGHAR